jgi:rhodanese-related sulfurtransferase
MSQSDACHSSRKSWHAERVKALFRVKNGIENLLSRRLTMSRSSKAAQRKTTKPAPTRLWITGILAAVLVVAAVAVVLALNGGQQSAVANALPDTISVQEAASKRDAGAFILDVRQPEEWVNDGHIPNASLIPLGELASRVNEVPQDAEILVICRSGNRSQEGRDILLRAGFTHVTSVAGGMNEWRAAGLPSVTGP